MACSIEVVLGFWFQSARAMFFLLILFTCACRSHANTGSFSYFSWSLCPHAFSEGRQHEICRFPVVWGVLGGGGSLFGFLAFFYLSVVCSPEGETLALAYSL